MALPPSPPPPSSAISSSAISSSAVQAAQPTNTRTPTGASTWASDRVSAMPDSIFTQIDNAKQDAIAQGLHVINLSIGASDLSPPEAALQALRDATTDANTYSYCLTNKTLPFRQAVLDWYHQRFTFSAAASATPNTLLTARDHILPLIGSQEGFANLLFATTDPGDIVLAPDPAFPSYFGAYALAQVSPYPLPLLAENDFLPDLETIPPDIADKAKILVLSYPNNPTSAIATAEFWQRAIAFCQRHHVILLNDTPYVDMTYDGYRAPSIFEFAGSLDVGIELYSCSKSFHMSGFRLGWALGNADILAALAKVKSAIDFNQYLGIQHAAVACLQDAQAIAENSSAIFQKRRDALIDALSAIGWDVPKAKGSLFLWAKVPACYPHSATTFALSLVEQHGVCLSPGDAFGTHGQGYVRFALVHDEATLQDAAQRIGTFLEPYRQTQ